MILVSFPRPNDLGFVPWAKNSSCAFRRICNTKHISRCKYIAILHRRIISHLQSEYIARRRCISLSPAGEIPFRKEKYMDKTIKELAVDLAIEITSVCDNIKGRSVFVNQLLRSCPLTAMKPNTHKARQTL